MKIKSVHIIILSAFALTFLVTGSASALTGSVASSTMKAEAKAAKIEKAVTKVKTASDTLLEKRIDDLNKLLTRIGDMKKLSASAKASITANVNSLIVDLATLKTEIDSTSSTTLLKTYRESITKAYRVYALAMPRVNIMAAADRANTMVDSLNSLAAKIQTRLNIMSLSGQITAAELETLHASLSDLSTKVGDANAQANAATAAVMNLVPDEGDKTVFAANTAALKSARAKIKTAQTDLVAAHKDAQSVVKAIAKGDKSVKNSTASVASTTVSVANCPDELIVDKMPGTGAPKSSYYIKAGQRKELADYDQTWVKVNCKVPVQEVQ
jgi:hypothetical protein